MLKENVSYMIQASFSIISSKFPIILSVYLDGDRDIRWIHQVDEPRPCEVGSFWWHQFHAVVRQVEVPLDGLEDFLHPQSRVRAPSWNKWQRHWRTKGGTQEAAIGRAYLSWTHPQRSLGSPLWSPHVHTIGEGNLGRSWVKIQGRGGRYQKVFDFKMNDE